MSIRIVVAAVFAASLTCATQARATEYKWTYGGDGHHSGSGTLTTTGANSPFTITAITGTFDGDEIVNLQDPGDCCGIPGNDNFLYSPPSTLLDENGLLSFHVRKSRATYRSHVHLKVRREERNQWPIFSPVLHVRAENARLTCCSLSSPLHCVDR